MTHSEAAPKDDNASMNTGKSTSKHPPSKIELTLMLFLSSGGKGVIQPEAHQAYGETCLHSSVSSLVHRHGIEIRGEPDKNSVKHYRQRPFKRYWLKDDKAKKAAINLLNHCRSKRGITTAILTSEVA